ncbi:MAG: glycogen/starch synthase, partial [Clostridiales bacterium]|nr:glycogen/starch synthase [Clostridiales bacterium]
KGGLLFSDKLVTVSESYASEIQHAYYGENLEGIIRNRARDVTGIMCGIDNELYDPETDPGLCANFSAKTRARLKPENKLRLQKLLGLKQDRDVPLIAVTADNLDFDKGMDLIKHVFYDIVGLGAQLVFASKGPIVDYHDFFTAKALELPRQVAYGRFNGNIAETMFIGGADMLLRPSRVEPCGEKHLIALRYGTAPIVRETGGLKDVVAPLDDNTGEGNGFSFANYNAHDMLYTVDRALSVYRGDRKAWGRLIDRGMALRLSWDDTAGKYMRVYDSLREEAAADDD